LAVERLMYRLAAMAGTDRPSCSRKSTSRSRGLNVTCSVRSWRRRIAWTRPAALNDDAATAECRMAATISAGAACFDTNADAPVSSARNSTSSSPCEVKITMPRSV
jgi:hypothetical protein